MSDLELTAKDQNQVHTVRIGESVSIRLPEIGGTAFLWHVTDAGVMELVADRCEMDEITPGAQMNRHLVFRPRRFGRMPLTLHRYRPWETPAEADAVASFVFDTQNVAPTRQ